MQLTDSSKRMWLDINRKRKTTGISMATKEVTIKVDTEGMAVVEVITAVAPEVDQGEEEVEDAAEAVAVQEEEPEVATTTECHARNKRIKQ